MNKTPEEFLREVKGRCKTRGPSSLVLPLLFIVLLGSAASALGQGVPDEPRELPPETAARLRRQITNGSDEEKRNALFEIRNFRSASASQIALAALRDKNEVVRATAAASIIFLPRLEAGAALIPLLGDRAEFVRGEASFALGEVRDSRAVAPLIRLMQADKVLEVRTAAAVALGKIGDRTAIESLAAVLKNRPTEDDEFLRRSAARSIGQIAQITATGNPTVLTPQNFLPEKFKELGTAETASNLSMAPVAVDILIGVLRSKNEADDTRREAAFSLGAIGDKKAAAALQSYLSDADPYLAEICKEALLKITRRNNPPLNDSND